MKLTLGFLCSFLLFYSTYSAVVDKRGVRSQYGWKHVIKDISTRAQKQEDEVEEELAKLIQTTLLPSLPPASSNSSSCSVCSKIMTSLVSLVDTIPSDDLILSMIEGMCTESKLMPGYVCHGAVYSQGPVLLYVARRTDVYPYLLELCSSLLLDDCDDDNGELWVVPLPDTPKPPVEDIPLPKSDSPRLKILQISDPHVDPYYVVGSASTCDVPMCCRDPITNSTVEPAGKWGSYECDTPLNELENLLQHISSTHQDIDYVLYIGDAPAHDFWNQDKKVALEEITTVNDYLRKYLPGKQVYPIIGNHDTFPINCFPPKSKELEGNDLDIDWLRSSVWDDWTKDWLPKEFKNDDLYYSISPYPGFRIISLHGNYLYVFNWWNYYFTEDPGNQLSWLVKQLQAAEDAGEKVHILIHVPPGRDALKTYSHNFKRIINRYESTVRGIFAGHTHYDEFQILFDSEDADRAVSVAYAAGSVTSHSQLNPAYRIITVDGNYPGSTYAVLDIDNYYLDLEKANSPDTGYKPEWKKLYSAKEEYQMDSLNPKEWKRVTDALIHDNDRFNTYYKNFHRNSPVFPACDADCKRKYLCNILTGDSSDRSKCEQLPEF